MRSLIVLSFALTLTILLAPAAVGQSGAASVTVNGQVSQAVFVTMAPGAQFSDERLLVTYTHPNSHTVLISINTNGSEARQISIPVELRSNVGFTLSATGNANGTTLRGLCVTGARATGRFVAAEAINFSNASACDSQTTGAQTHHANRDAQAFSFPYTLLTGPRISLAGTFNTPSNALEATVLIDIQPQVGQENASIEITLSASPDSQQSGF